MSTYANEVYDKDGRLVSRETGTLPVETQNLVVIQQKVSQALAANETFMALVTPTNAQVVAQVRTLTKECNALIRMLLGQFDSTIDT